MGNRWTFTRRTFTRLIALVGDVLVWLPFALLLVTGAGALMARGGLQVDYLIPAEVAPIPLAGGGLLLWAALRARSHRRVIGWSLAAAVILLAGGQVLAVVTGLASGVREATGWRLALVVATFGGYTLALIVMGVGGASLVRRVFKRE